MQIETICSSIQLHIREFLRYSGGKERMKKKLEEHREGQETLSSQAKILLSKLTKIKRIPVQAQ